MTKRILSLVMAFLMLSALFISCTNPQTPLTSKTPISSTPSGQSTPTPTSVTPESPTDIPGNSTPTPTPTCDTVTVGYDDVPMPSKLKEIIEDGGFNKEEVGIIVSGRDLATRSIYVDKSEVGYHETDPVNIAVEHRNEIIEEKLNIKLKVYMTVSPGALVNHLREYKYSPDSDLQYDIIGAYQYFDLGLGTDYGSTGGLLLDLTSLKEEDMFIDLDGGYWDRDSYETLGYSGKNFWLTGDLSQTWVTSMYVSYVNQRLWKENIDEIKKYTDGEEDIYKVVKSGKWSIDLWLKLNEILYTDLNDNGTIDEGDQVGFVGYAKACGISNIVVDGLFSGSHVTFSQKKDGLPSIEYPTQDFKNYADATGNLYNNSQSLFLPSYKMDRTAMHVFADGKALMTVSALGHAGYLYNMADDYYILPPPKSNDNQDNYYTTTGDSVNQFGIWAESQNIRIAVATLEALGFYSKQYVTPAIYNEFLKGKYITDDNRNAAEMLDFIRSRIYSDFVLAWGCFMGSQTESPLGYLRNNIGGLISGPLVTSAKRIEWKKQLEIILNEELNG